MSVGKDVLESPALHAVTYQEGGKREQEAQKETQ